MACRGEYPYWWAGKEGQGEGTEEAADHRSFHSPPAAFCDSTATLPGLRQKRETMKIAATNGLSHPGYTWPSTATPNSI